MDGHRVLYRDGVVAPTQPDDGQRVWILCAQKRAEHTVEQWKEDVLRLNTIDMPPDDLPAGQRGCLLPDLKAQALSQGAEEKDSFPVADVSQTGCHGHVDLLGLWGLSAPSTRLMSMGNFQVMSGAGLMRMMGHCLDDKHTEGLADGESFCRVYVLWVYQKY